MNITFFWFHCPSGHLGLVDEEQAAGSVSIVCYEECGFRGFVQEGTLGEKHAAPDEMSHLRG